MSEINPAAQAGLTSAQEQFLLLNVSDAIPAPIFYKDTELKYIGCNKAFEDFFQKSRKELAGKSITDFYPEGPEKARHDHQDRDQIFLKSSESRYAYESNIPDKDGNIHHFIITKAKFYHPDGSLAGVVGIMFDNTERKLAQDAFMQEKAFLRALMDAIPNPIVYKDVHLKYLDCNKAFEEFSNCSKEKLIGKTAFEVFPSERAKMIEQRDRGFLESNEKYIIYENAFDAWGQIRDFSITRSKFYQSNHSVGGFVTTVFDVTEHKALEKHLREINQQLSDKNAQILSGIEYASRVQKNIFLEQEAILEQFPEAFIFFCPKDIVSGDFYWFARKKDILLIAAVDCTGHGVPGALMTVLGNELLNQIVYEQNIMSPDRILSVLDHRLKGILQKRDPKHEIPDGMELSICSIHLKKRQLQFAGARSPLYYVRDGILYEIQGSSSSIGGKQRKEKAHFKAYTRKIKKNDIFYLFTDGFQDQLNKPLGRRFMAKRFKAFLTEISLLPLQEQKERLKAEFENWKGNHIQTDDILVMGFKVVV